MEQDPQLLWPVYKSFRNAQKQHVHGVQFVEVEPTAKSETQFEFELSGNEPLAWGVGTGFRVEGTFQMKAPKPAATQEVPNPAEPPWETLTLERAKKVNLVQNWFGHYIKNLEVFYVNQNVTQDDIPPNITAPLEAFIYGHMDKDIKRMLCMEKCHPGYGTSVDHGDFKAITAGIEANAWTRYAAEICKEKIEFVYTPLNKFPFYQECNYTEGENGGFNILPIAQLGRMQIRVYFKENSSVLFNLDKTVDKYEYRFKLSKFTLLLKEYRMSPAYNRALWSSKQTYTYRGLTKIGICENLTPANFTHRTTIPNIDFPEALFIFCVDKKVISGTAEYQELGIDGPFLYHNIKSVDVHFNGQHFFVNQPTFGTLENLQLRRENFAKWVKKGCFGIKFDKDVVTWDRQGKGYDCAFDNVWIDFCQNDSDSRLQTFADQTYTTNKMGDLTVILNFAVPDGATDASYILLVYYTNFALQLDMKNKRFSAVYNRNKAIN